LCSWIDRFHQLSALGTGHANQESAEWKVSLLDHRLRFLVAPILECKVSMIIEALRAYSSKRPDPVIPNVSPEVG
jgi:hypothetical protein